MTSLLVVFIIYYCSTSYTLREEPDLVVDGLLIFLLAISFKQDLSSLKKLRTLAYFLTAIFCIKAAYFYDNTESIELPLPKEVNDWKPKI